MDPVGCWDFLSHFIVPVLFHILWMKKEVRAVYCVQSKCAVLRDTVVPLRAQKHIYVSLCVQNIKADVGIYETEAKITHS